MIIGIGLDLIEIERIQKSVQKNKKMIERILTPEERSIYAEISSERRKAEFLAGRFAAKEAFAKATGKGIGKLSFQHINVLNNDMGAPRIEAKGYEDVNVFVSITHSHSYAAAQVIIEK